MTRRLLLTYLSITAFILLILGIPLGINFADKERERLTTDLERDATVIATLVEDRLETGAGSDPVPVVTEYEERTNGRVVIVDKTGVAVADSSDPEGPARDFSTRPELEAALAGERAFGTRYSETLGKRITYVAVPVASGGTVHGAVRISHDTAELDAAIRRNWVTLGLIGLVVMGAVTVVGFILARSVTQPVRALAEATGSLAAGDLDARAEVDRGAPEVRSLARRFNEMATRIEELVGSQRAFVADASHQLRTPLTALRLRLENLQSAAPEALQRDLEASSEEVARLGRLVEGLLAIARTEGSRPRRVRMDAAAITRQRVDVWTPLAEERGLRLVLEADGASPVETIDGALDQILDNLLDNSLDAAPAGSAIVVTVDRSDDTVDVRVADNGPGLTHAQKEQAFNRFWRGPDAGSTGSGLGLAIVQQLATAGGGDVELRDVDPNGLEVTIRLPAASHGSLRADGAS